MEGVYKDEKSGLYEIWKYYENWRMHGGMLGKKECLELQRGQEI